MEKIALEVGKEIGKNESKISRMIKKTKADISAMDSEYEAFLKQKRKKQETGEENVVFFKKRVAILNGKYGGDVKQAEKDKEYIQLGKKLDKAEPIIAAMEKKVEKKMKNVKTMRNNVVVQIKKILEYKSDLTSDFFTNDLKKKLTTIKDNLHFR